MSFWRTFYHLVWTTKNRAELITPKLEPRLFGYLVNKAAEIGVYVYAVNGWTDHVHLVVAIPPEVSVAQAVKIIKGASSHYVNELHLLQEHFAWQEGYGVFTLGEKQRASAVAYVRNQKEHHHDQTTNAWLEQSAKLDHGPADPGLAPIAILALLRDEAAQYATEDDLPF